MLEIVQWKEKEMPGLRLANLLLLCYVVLGDTHSYPDEDHWKFQGLGGF